MAKPKRSSATASPPETKRGPWTPHDDKKLFDFVQQHGHGSWRTLPQKAGLQRCGKSCRLRWRNYLNPDIKRGNFTVQEDQTIIQLHALLGNRWSAIAAQLPKRTDNEIKNYWNSHLKKRLAKIGFDPVTHKSKTAILASANGADPRNISNLSHIAQWESARLQAEARFSRQSNLLVSSYDQPAPSRSAAGSVAEPQCQLDMNERARDILLLLKSILAADNGGQGGVGGGGSTTAQVGSFGNADAEGNYYCDKFDEDPINSASAFNFNEIFEECSADTINNECCELLEAVYYNHNGIS